MMIIIIYQIQVNYSQDEEKITQLKAKEGHYIIASNTDVEVLSDPEVVTVYQKQYHVERGFCFLKDPLFFASFLFVKTPREKILRFFGEEVANIYHISSG